MNDDIKIEVITDSKEQEKIQPELDRIKEAALQPIKFELNEVEIKSFKKFTEKHGPGICEAPKYIGGECFVFCFTPSGYCDTVKVTCSCGAEKDITDPENYENF